MQMGYFRRPTGERVRLRMEYCDAGRGEVDHAALHLLQTGPIRAAMA